MSVEEWLELHLSRAPQITDEQWEDTVAILGLTRRGRRASGQSPAGRGRVETSAPGRVGGIRDRRPPADSSP